MLTPKFYLEQTLQINCVVLGMEAYLGKVRYSVAIFFGDEKFTKVVDEETLVKMVSKVSQPPQYDRTPNILKQWPMPNLTDPGDIGN